MATGFLMYHELARPGRPLNDTDPGYVRYAIDESRFARQLATIAAGGLRGTSVGEWRTAGGDATGLAVITFDDGCETDLVVAAPLLSARGFSATFYVVSTWVGRPGFLTPSQLRELSRAGFEIGSHSATHAFLSGLDDTSLQREIVDSKRQLEDIVGSRVVHLSCPGGRWSRRVAAFAREAGYATVATSRIGTNGATSDPHALARCAIQRDTTTKAFDAFCRGAGLTTMLVRDRALAAAKTLLGNRIYTSLRGAALKGGAAS